MSQSGGSGESLRSLRQTLTRLFNGLTRSNFHEVARQVCDLFLTGRYARSAVIEATGTAVVRTLLLDKDGASGSSMDVAALLRAMQILVDAQVIKVILDSLEKVSADHTEGDDDSGRGIARCVGTLFALGGVDAHEVLKYMRAACGYGEAGLPTIVLLMEACGQQITRSHPVAFHGVASEVFALSGLSPRASALVDQCKSFMRKRHRQDGSDTNPIPVLAAALAKLLPLGSSKRNPLQVLREFNRLESVGESNSVTTPSTSLRSSSIADAATAAHEQRFSSEVKRQIFEVVVNATDDFACFQALAVRDPNFSQAPDVFFVLIQSCFQEVTPNPFYHHVCARMLGTRKQLGVVLQFALWDKFRAIRDGRADVSGYVNLACFIAGLVEASHVRLAVFRGLDLDVPSKTINLFTRIAILKLLLELSHTSLLAFFLETNQSSLSDLRELLSQFFGKNFGDRKELQKWLPLVHDVVRGPNSVPPQELLKRIAVVNSSFQ